MESKKVYYVKKDIPFTTIKANTILEIFYEEVGNNKVISRIVYNNEECPKELFAFITKYLKDTYMTSYAYKYKIGDYVVTNKKNFYIILSFSVKNNKYCSACYDKSYIVRSINVNGKNNACTDSEIFENEILSTYKLYYFINSHGMICRDYYIEKNNLSDFTLATSRYNFRKKIGNVFDTAKEANTLLALITSSKKKYTLVREDLVVSNTNK